MIRLIFLGRFRELARPDLAAVDLPGDVATLAGLQAWLERTHPELAGAVAAVPTQWAVNQTLVRDPQHPLRDGDEVAFLPPMSGG